MKLAATVTARALVGAVRYLALASRRGRSEPFGALYAESGYMDDDYVLGSGANSVLAARVRQAEAGSSDYLVPGYVTDGYVG